MDTLAFQFDESTFKPYDDAPILTYGIDVLINDEIVSGTLNVQSVLALPCVPSSEIYLFTCSCGVPECAGIWDTISHKVEGDKVIWRIKEHSTHEEKARNLVFDLNLFLQSIYDLKSEIISREAKGEFHSTCTESLFTELDESIIGVHVSDYLPQIEHNLKLEFEFDSFLKAKAPDLYGRKFIFEYDGNKSKFDLTLDELVCRILNDSPRRFKGDMNSNNYFHTKSALALKAIYLALDNDFSLMFKMTHRSYKEFETHYSHSIFNLTYMDEQVESTSNFDPAKLIFKSE